MMDFFGLSIDQTVDYIILIGAVIVAFKNILNPLLKTSEWFNKKFSMFISKKADEKVEEIIKESVPKAVEKSTYEMKSEIKQINSKVIDIGNQNKEQGEKLNIIEQQNLSYSNKLETIEKQNEIQGAKLVTIEQVVNAVRKGTRDSLRAEMLKIYYKYADFKKIPSYDKQTFLEMYDSYQKVGGNSFILEVKNDICNNWEEVSSQKDIEGFCR